MSFVPTPVVETRDQRALGVIFIIILLQLFAFLIPITQTQLVPGDWSSLVTKFEFYLFLGGFMVSLMVLFPRTPTRKAEPLWRFTATLSGVGMAVWAFFTVTFTFLHYPIAGSALSGTIKLQQIVLLGLFVAPTEEMAFRVVLPRYMGGEKYKDGTPKRWWVSAIILFAGFHVLAYYQAGPNALANLGSSLVNAGLYGAIFYGIYWKLGFGAAVGAHFMYDAFVSGVVIPFFGHTLGLLPV